MDLPQLKFANGFDETDAFEAKQRGYYDNVIVELPSRGRYKDRVHFWPFDAWSVLPNRSVVAEVYPSLWSMTFPTAGRTPEQQDAFATAEWLRRVDMDANLEKFLCPELEPNERKTAEIEGWILGVA